MVRQLSGVKVREAGETVATEGCLLVTAMVTLPPSGSLLRPRRYVVELVGSIKLMEYWDRVKPRLSSSVTVTTTLSTMTLADPGPLTSCLMLVCLWSPALSTSSSTAVTVTVWGVA